MKKTIKLLILAAAVVLQTAVIILPLLYLRQFSLPLNTIFTVISMLMVFYLIRLDINPAYKIPWIFILLVFPFFGWIVYGMYGKNYFTRKERRRFANIGRMYMDATALANNRIDELKEVIPYRCPEAKYLMDYGNSAVYGGTSCKYFSCGEDMYEALLTELAKAENFIFMEYFIIEEGKMLSQIVNILIDKVKKGVEVRLMYDSLGSLSKAKDNSIRLLKAAGVECYEFNRLISLMDNRYNNRDHRKICVIDGNVGFTGGINIADEYINETHPFGEWKDSAVMLKGEGVWGLTIMFLTLLYGISDVRKISEEYRPHLEVANSAGFFIPFTDYPIDDEANGRNVYLNLINRARKYVYIMSPYLILDNVLVVALENAAKSGVDVRIMTPGKGDKKLIYLLTRSYYEPLIKAGVKIYEYTPGFLHSKSMVSDDEVAVVGTINLDYRSLAHHYEDAVWMCGTPVINDIKEDFCTTISECREITLEFCRKKSIFKSLLIPILRLFAPML